MLARKLSGIRQQLTVVRERVAALPAVVRFGYIGGQGDANLGDDAMFDVARRLIPSVQVVPYSFPAHEQRLSWLGLAGRRYFNEVILGGGTFINPYGLGTTRMALRQGLPLWTLGTGVGSGGFGMATRPELSEWRALLSDFRRLGVRGPRSKATLEALGVPRAEVLGDLALALALEQPMAPATPPRFAVNITLPPPSEERSWSDETLLGPLVEAIRHLESTGYEAVFFGMHRNDVEPLRQLTARLGRPEAPLHLPQRVEDFFACVGPCAFTLCVRLHAAVLSTCAGVPPLSLAYRDKCLDFMESMELEEWCLDVETLRSGELYDRVLHLSARAPAMRSTVLARAQGYQERIRAYVADLVPAEGAGARPG